MKYLQLTFVPMKKFNSLAEVAYRPANSAYATIRYRSSGPILKKFNSLAEVAYRPANSAYATIRYRSSGPILTKNFEEREKLAHS